MKHQYSLKLIQHQTNQAVISQRASDGYVNATTLCKAAGGKRTNNYLRNSDTQEFLHELSVDLGIEVQLSQKSAIKKNQALIESFPGAPETGGGTWVHPQVAVHLGQWLSPKFAVLVSKWVHDWLSGKQAPDFKKAKLPYHIERYLLNHNAVPNGHFSVLQEITFHLIAPLEKLGYTIPKKMMPDISEGRMLCAYARDELGIDTDSFPTYTHRWDDERKPVKPKAYPNELLATFRDVIVPRWLEEKAHAYFKPRDPAALQYLDKLLALAAPTKPTAMIPRCRPWRADARACRSR